MGFEKISDQYYRQCRIEELRKKVLVEIETKRKVLIECIGIHGSDTPYTWSLFAKEFFALDTIEKYFSDPYLFSDTKSIHYDCDKVAYYFRYYTIDNMLKDSCNVVKEWLNQLNKNDGYDHIRDYLNSDYFETIFSAWWEQHIGWRDW